MDNTIDAGDALDGSDGGYDKHGNFIIPKAMLEIIDLRKQNAALFEAASKAVRVYEHGERIDMLDAMMKLRAAIELATKEDVK